ncbi:MAG: 4-hydroxy-3-methylbut-2-enyl diphosphate reductase [Verrucomicrobia bacterium]|nr:4-hydroxy-3-methylbut-2-enyl diphosphate reductase [Verrucomicrobiota bacterium]
MKILRASHLGMCFGVRDAIALALDQPEPITVLGELVHNETVLRQLHEHGIAIEREPAAVSTSTVMITAHGASQRRLAEVHARGLRIIEATCPLVHAAHRAVRRLVREGWHPVIVGQRDHVEVCGIIEDLAEFEVVLTEEDVAGLVERPRFGVAAQTTQPIDRVKRLVAALGARFPKSEVRFVDTVCQPTKLRQHAAVELARQCDVVVVIGGAHSNNTRELAATCAAHCSRVHHVQTADELRPEWFAGATTVGLTAGTSTPDETIDAVEKRLHEFAEALLAHAW